MLRLKSTIWPLLCQRNKEIRSENITELNLYVLCVCVMLSSTPEVGTLTISIHALGDTDSLFQS